MSSPHTLTLTEENPHAQAQGLAQVCGVLTWAGAGEEEEEEERGWKMGVRSRRRLGEQRS